MISVKAVDADYIRRFAIRIPLSMGDVIAVPVGVLDVAPDLCSARMDQDGDLQKIKRGLEFCMNAYEDCRNGSDRCPYDDPDQDGYDVDEPCYNRLLGDALRAIRTLEALYTSEHIEQIHNQKG